MAIFPILVHSGFYKILLESDSNFRGRVRETLLRLQSGQWGQGTRVKRLAGVGQAVYEARLDRGNRLLFTAVRAADPNDPERLSTHLQIWDAVRHTRSHGGPSGILSRRRNSSTSRLWSSSTLPIRHPSRRPISTRRVRTLPNRYCIF